MPKIFKLSTIIGLVFFFSSLNAHPTAYEDAKSVMSMNSPKMNELFAHYSFSPKLSLGVKYIRIEESKVESYSVFPQLSVLLHRWNHKAFQANVYAYGGYGGNWANDKRGTSVFYGGEADIEDRRLYTSVGYQVLRLSEFRDHPALKARAGVAAYLAEYTEPAVWGIVQYEWHPEAETKHEVTPLVRIFYKNALVESGVSLKGDWLLNLMIHY